MIWINGEFVDDDNATVSVADSGLLHAVGVFTTMRADRGKAFCLDRHLKRLRGSCEALFIPLQYTDKQLVDATDQLLQQMSLAEARLRLTVTRGRITQDALHGAQAHPTCFLTATALQPYPAELYETGLTATVVDDQKLNPYDMQAGHKTLNYFTRLQSLKHARDRGGAEALWFDVHHYLQSAALGNVFAVIDGVLTTPPTPGELRDSKLRESMPYEKSCVLPGITRSVILELAAEAGVEHRLGAIDIRQLLNADELFMCNSIAHIVPICRVERKAIGNDKPGDITRKLMGLLGDRVLG